MPSLHATFAAEAAETLSELELGLLQLEQRGRDADALHAVFRAAHNLKGAARVAGFIDVGELAHVAEELLVRLRDGKLQPTRGNITILLAAVDELRAMITTALASARGETGDTATDAAGAASGRGASTVRVDTRRIDQLVDLIGEILLSRSRIAAMLQDRQLARPAILEAHGDASRLYDDLREAVMGLKLVPIAPLFQAQARAVRDVAAALGKQVRLDMVDAGVQIDATLADVMRDPLTHMLRNAIDHSLEMPEQRVAAGKPPHGTVTLASRRDGGMIEISICDDGRGFDLAGIRAKAIARGDIAADAVLDDDALIQLVLLPGFSTAAAVTDLSGRGVGMDVVRRNIESVRGTLALATTPGRGSSVTVRLPLSLAIIGGFQVTVGDEVLILPSENVLECIAYVSPSGPEAGRPGSMTRGPREDEARPTTVLSLRGRPLPAVRLRRVFEIPGVAPPGQSVVVVRHRDQPVGFVVDRLRGEAPIVVKPLARLLNRGGPVAASALTGGGQVALILDIDGVVRHARSATPRASAST
jgi:two-component system chemotaxis sensor kinase CheA